MRAALRVLPGPRAAVWPLVLAWCLICGVLTFLPRWWLAGWRESTLNHWFEVTHTQASRLTQEWEHWTVRVPAFNSGNEKVVSDWLAREPLVTALVDPEKGRVWIRDGSRLRPARDAEEGRIPSEWVRAALEVAPTWTSPGPPGRVPRAHRIGENFDAGAWWLVGSSDPNWKSTCSIVTFFGKWCLVKKWNPGSPAVEQWLRGTLGVEAPYRLGLSSCLKKSGGLNSLPSATGFEHPAVPGVPDTLQVSDPGAAPSRADPELSSSFGGCWHCILQMSPATFKAFRKAYILRQSLAWTSYGLLVAGSGLALSLVLFARNRERVLADRLATLTHSLKTPLAVLKLRCDTALNVDMPRERQEARLLEIRGEVDQLVRTIEAGLEEMRTRYAGRKQDAVDGSFFERLDEDMTPAFESKGRLLEVYASDLSFRCCTLVLKAALATLVENALMHGKGQVEVRAVQIPGKVTVSVSDEGEGVPQDVLRALRDRPRSVKGSPPDRMDEGLGLLVLARLVKQEGWGLTFGHVGHRNIATVEIPV